MVYILPLFTAAIFKSLWFMQEAIVTLFLGKVALAEENDSPPWRKIRGPCLLAQNSAWTIPCGHSQACPQGGLRGHSENRVPPAWDSSLL